MQKIGIVMSVFFILSLLLASGAYAQSRGMDQGNYNYRYQSEQQRISSPAVRGQVVGTERYYGQPGPPETVVFTAVVPPPTRSDILSERINRKCVRPARVYVETNQGVPTRFGKEVARACYLYPTASASGQRSTVQGYYPQSERPNQGYQRSFPNQGTSY